MTWPPTKLPTTGDRTLDATLLAALAGKPKLPRTAPPGPLVKLLTLTVAQMVAGRAAAAASGWGQKIPRAEWDRQERARLGAY